jgi:LacI family transcriptional regulator
VDNDEGICETWRIPISSVAVNAEKIGYETAALLDRMMAGERPPTEPIEIPPICVEQRESTAGLGVRDRAVVKAVSAMREGIDQALTIDGLAAALGISRRHLDRRFSDALGRTAAEELRRLRVERARRLLRETNKNVLQVALDCGFSDANRLNAAFRATLGMSPTAYRRQLASEPRATV